jgi:hypothetical protein
VAVTGHYTPRSRCSETTEHTKKIFCNSCVPYLREVLADLLSGKKNILIMY